MNKHKFSVALMVVLLVSLLCMPQLAGAERKRVDSAKSKDIKKLVKAMGFLGTALRFARAHVDSRISALQKVHPDIPKTVLVSAKRELISFIQARIWASGGLEDELIPIYDKYLTHAEIGESIKFFESPAGKKWLSIAMPMMNDLMLAGNQWQQDIESEVKNKLKTHLKRQGYSLSKLE